MQFQPRILVIAAGALVMIVIGIVLALSIRHRNPDTNAPPPAAQTGLIIDVKQGAEIKRDPSQQYRCFKNGQYVGMATLDQCAKENGVLSGALDVGIDQTGALAAAEQLGANIAPLPPKMATNAPLPAAVAPPPAAPVAPAPAVAPPPATPPIATVSRGPASTCQRYDHGWTSLGEMPLGTCLQLLYAGHCERPGGALYGRWGDQSLRLVPGRVESSRDDRVFSKLVDQGPGCTIPSP